MPAGVLTRAYQPPAGDIASTSEVVASTQYPTTSTGLSRFVPEVEAVEAVEANPTTLRGWIEEGDERMISSHEDEEGPELESGSCNSEYKAGSKHFCPSRLRSSGVK